jgi:transposase
VVGLDGGTAVDTWACPVSVDIRDEGPEGSGRMSRIMDSMGRKRQRPRRSFTPEFRAEIVALCRRDDHTVAQVVREYDLTDTAVRNWIRQADIDDGSRSGGLTSGEQDELARLRRENQRLREDNDVLRRATAFFARETR